MKERKSSEENISEQAVGSQRIEMQLGKNPEDVVWNEILIEEGKPSEENISEQGVGSQQIEMQLGENPEDVVWNEILIEEGKSSEENISKSKIVSQKIEMQLGEDSKDGSEKEGPEQVVASQQIEMQLGENLVENNDSTRLILGSEEEIKKLHNDMLSGIGRILERGMEDHQGPVLYDGILRDIFKYVDNGYYALSGNSGAEIRYKTKDNKKEVVIKESEKKDSISITLVKHESSFLGCQKTKSVTNYVEDLSIFKENEKGQKIIAKKGNNLKEALECLLKIYKDHQQDTPGLSPALKEDVKTKQVKTSVASQGLSS